MKKMLCALSVLAFLLMNCVLPAWAERGDLSRYANSGKPIKVFVSQVTDDSGEDAVKPEEFRSALENLIAKRKAVKFEVVKDAAASDLQISAAIKKYKYLVHGPMKPSPSIATLALDAAATATQNYVEMTVAFTILETKTNKVLWDDSIAEYRKKTMTPGESIPIIYERLIRTFLWKSFGKPTS